MKLKLEFDDDGVIYDLMDTVFVALLKRAMNDSMKVSGYSHPDDIAQQHKVAEACHVLIEYYDDPSD